jgi:hypothetical protein
MSVISRNWPKFEVTSKLAMSVITAIHQSSASLTLRLALMHTNPSSSLNLHFQLLTLWASLEKIIPFLFFQIIQQAMMIIAL